MGALKKLFNFVNAKGLAVGEIQGDGITGADGHGDNLFVGVNYCRLCFAIAGYFCGDAVLPGRQGIALGVLALRLLLTD